MPADRADSPPPISGSFPTEPDALREPTRYLLVLTATIRPANLPGIKRKDVQLRLNDYLTALRFWLSYPDPRLRKILFLENSGYDLSAIQHLVEGSNSGKEVEIISVPGNNIPPGIGYGYGELEMLDQGLGRSELRKFTTHMVKVTGRLMFPTLTRLLDRLPLSYEIAVDCRHRGRFLMILERIFKSPGVSKVNPRTISKIIRDAMSEPSKPFTACQLMIYSHRFYDRYLRTSYHEMRTPYPRLIENLICDRLVPFEGQEGILLRWPINVEPYGFAGHAAKRYDSVHRILIRQTRGIMRRLAPNLWF